MVILRIYESYMFLKSSSSLKKQKDGSMSKEPKNQSEKVLNSQIWNNLSNTLSYIVFEINICKFILINDWANKGGGVNFPYRNLCRYSAGNLIISLPPSLECGLYLVISFQDTFCGST